MQHRRHYVTDVHDRFLEQVHSKVSLNEAILADAAAGAECGTLRQLLAAARLGPHRGGERKILLQKFSRVPGLPQVQRYFKIILQSVKRLSRDNIETTTQF